MSVFSTIRDWLSGGEYKASRWRSSDSTFDDLSWISQTWSSPSATGIQINQQTAMSCAAVMACVSLIAEDVSKLTPRLWDPSDDGGRKEIRNHPVLNLLRHPNDWQTWFEFCGQMMLGLLLRGNGYAVIVRDGGGKPLYLVPINPDRVSLWEAPDGSLFWNVTRAGLHEMAVLRDQPLLIPDYDIFHLKGLSANGLLGFSKIALNRETIGLALAQEQQAARWMGQGAKPGGVLTTDQKLTPEAHDRAKASWTAAQEGLINSGKTAVLEMGLKWQPLRMSAQDVDFIASRNFQKEEIAALWRVPPHMIGIQSRGQNQNITQQSQDYFNTTLSTYTVIWAQRLDFTFGLSKEGIEPEFDRAILLEGDVMARMQAYRLGLQGVWTTNEVRKLERLGPAQEGDDVAAGDRVFRPANMAPIDSDIFAGIDAPGGLKPDGAPGSDVTGAAPAGAGDPTNPAANPDQHV
jgi:HK97 family phage portal protein